MLFDNNNNELNKLLMLKDKINDKIVSYKKYKEVEHINDINKNKLTELNKNITINENKLLELLNDQNNLKNELNIITNNKIIYEKLLEEYKNLEYKIVLYTNICKLVDTNGIPLKIIQSKLDYIQNGVNNMLLKFINKKIIITHINEFKNFTSNNIYINKKNELSYINF